MSRGRALSETLLAYSGGPQFLLQQVAWWACVLWMAWIGPIVMLAFIALHLVVMRHVWRLELGLVLLSALLGLALDNTLAALGSVTYVGELLVGRSPLWLVAIWAGFGATLRHSQRVFMTSGRAALISGLLAGPLAYFGGEKLERLIIHGSAGLVAIGLLWALVLTLLYRALRWGEGAMGLGLAPERAEER